MIGAILVMSFIVMASKSPDSLSSAQFWAEDGTIFFAQQFDRHALLIAKGYAGYMHAIPRTVAWMASFFDNASSPFIYDLMANLLAAVSMAYAAIRLRSHFPLLLSLAIFLFVPVNGEIFGTLANVQWFLQFALIALCLPVPPRHGSNRREYLVLIAAGLMALTGPTSIFVSVVNLSLLAANELLKRLRRDTPFSTSLAEHVGCLPKMRIAVVGVCAVAQLIFLALHAWEVPTETHGIVQYGPVTLPVVLFGRLWPTHAFGFYFMTSALWLLVGAAMLTVAIRTPHLRFGTKVIVLQLVVLTALTTLSASALKDATAMLQFIMSDRYFYLSKFVFWWLAYLVLASQWPKQRAGVLLAMLCVLAYVGAVGNQRLQRQPFPDLEWKTHAAELGHTGDHAIPVNPIPWTIHLQTSSREEEHVMH